MARQMNDISLTESEDLDFSTGDIELAESTAQHQKQILLNYKGDFKENPTICAGAFSYIDDENRAALIRSVHVEFSRDGMNVYDVGVTGNGAITSKANYQ